MAKIKPTVTKSNFRCEYCHEGDPFIAESFCPPRSAINCGIAFYPYLFAPQNDAGLDYGDARRCFDAKYPDPGRIRVHGEIDHN